MSLLREIQNDAVNSNVKVSDLLRKCKILAYRLGNDDFKNWVESELNGYSQTEILPNYRVLSVNSKGHFSGAFGSGLRNADMPIFCLPSELQENYSIAKFNSPIATLESLSSSDSGVLTQDWNLIILAKYGSAMYEGYNCIQAWKVIPASAVIGMVDTVKTKILNFALEIEMINKDAGDVEINSNPIPQDKVSQIFNINISGNVGNLSSGNSNSNIQQEVTNTQLPEDFINLISDLKHSQIEDELALEVEKRLEQLGTAVGTHEYKTQYSDLINFASNHVTVLGFLAPYLVMLTNFIT
ncbi:hypothetical protein J7649_13430 [Acinetobacter lwoffii]|uniref:AbiTii domain-containing protein n=1 Tax=Acinetobacter lwoffii TaxID=28090 RepID=UPI001C5B1763|nr:hypothetical protein [Acinetobacter lwoffii]QXX86357.1 hypothetical protein J7649_13430 [Acinetobacter lwoffii]